MLESPYFRRVFLPYLVIIVVATAGMGAFAVAQLRSSYLECEREALREESRLVHALIAEDLEQDRPEQVASRIAALSEVVDCRITIVADDGRVVADTLHDPAQLDNFRLRPEIVVAAADGEGLSVRRSETAGEDMLYVATRVAGPEGRARYLRLGLPLQELRRQSWTLSGGLATAAALAALVAGIACWAFARRHAAPLVDLARLARAYAKGELDRRSHHEGEGQDEIGALARAFDDMAGSLQRLMSQAEKDREQLLTILAGMSEGVLATDRQQAVILVNEAAATLLDFPRDGARGRALWDLVRHELILKAAGEVLDSGAAKRLQIGPVRGRQLEVAVCALPSPPPPSGPEGLVIVAHDRTEAARYEDLRKEFVANVSHELRTPLTMIRGFVETLREGALANPAKGPEYLAIIEKHVAQLGNLVDDLLQLSSLESRPALPRCVRVDVAEVARRAAELMRPAAGKKGLALTIEAAGAERLAVAGDPDYLERAVGDVVDNAIKYTPEGGSIRVSVRRAGETRVAIEVADTGIGIAAEDLPRIFERFYRVDRSRSREMGGTGLGLSIVKHVVQAHDGTVEVESTPGKGSTFRLVLPAAP